MRPQPHRRRGLDPVASDRRRSQRLLPRARVLIVCEGEATEPCYFKAHRSARRLRTATVEVRGHECGSDPQSVVGWAARQKQLATRNRDPFDSVWCVFDLDQRADADIRAARELAGSHGIRVALSDPCFELWYLLHFRYSTAFVSGEQVIAQLEGSIGGYTKSRKLYAELVERQEDAIGNAERLRAHHGQFSGGRISNPSTLVDLLVVELNNLGR